MNLIELSQTDDTDTYTAPGRRPDENDEYMRIVRSLSPRMSRVLAWMAMGGVFTVTQLDIPVRRMRAYQHKKLFSRLLHTTLYGEPLYCLGEIGERIVRQRYAPMPPLTGYVEYTQSRVLHDVYLNEVVLRMAEAARAKGWRTWWVGTNAAEIRKGSEQIVEPDSLLVLEREGQRKAFAIEYHNEEDKRQRAFEKVRRYERLRDMPDLWMNAWELDEFPAIVAVFRDAAVGNGYRAATQEMQTQNTYYGKLLNAFAPGETFQNLQEWVNVNTGGKEALF